jgi:8-oxo-dGTP diphosphatase
VRSVVGAAIVQDGRLLAARRPKSSAAPGWEFPGGKVEEGESPAEALVREIHEELGCTIEVGVFFDDRVPVGTDFELSVAPARVIAGEPIPHEHDAIRWLARDELDQVEWLPADRPFLDAVRGLLS